jgi:hypothetical protein
MKVAVYDARDKQSSMIENVTKVTSPRDGRHLVEYMEHPKSKTVLQVPAGYRVEIEDCA